MSELREIYTLKLAYFLRTKGLNVIKTGVNPHKPELNTWFFEDTPELREYMNAYSATRSKHERRDVEERREGC